MTKNPVSRAKVDESLEKASKDLEKFEEGVKKLTLDEMNKAPLQEVEPQTKMSTQDIDKSDRVYLKPVRKISSREKFNEKFRSKYEFDTEYVQFIAENKEIIGEEIPVWTKPYPGMPAEEWKVPVNKPVWGPRHLAEQIRRKTYHRLMTEQKTIINDDFGGSYTGQMVVDKIIPRLSAEPVTSRRSVFMGVND